VIVPIVCGAAVLALFVRHALRTTQPLIDLRLYLNRTFTVSSITLVLLVVSVFGGMLLLPLYLQVVRGESPMDTGLLLAPQGFGAMIAMPIAGRLTDRTGVGRIVPVGLILVALSFLALTQLGPDTNYVWFGVVLWVMGLGMGATMMPTFSGAMQTLRHSDVARASTTLNIQQQVGASIGTAVLSVLLANAISARLGGHGGIGGATGAVPPSQRATVMDKLADAFGHTYWWALALVIVAFCVATPLLPKRKPAPVGDADASPPVLMH
jgi:predicted MFS family arabinose efflux permease